MPSCVDCLNCKVTKKWTELKCSKHGWWYNETYKSHMERTVKLENKEIDTLDILNRKLFRVAEECSVFEDMG